MPAGRTGRERRSRWAVKADALQPWPTPSRGWRGPQAEQAEDSGLLKALPPVTYSWGSAQRGRCPYRHAPLVGLNGQNPRGYNHGGSPESPFQHCKGTEQRSVDNCPAHRLGPVDGLRFGSSPPRQILSL